MFIDAVPITTVRRPAPAPRRQPKSLGTAIAGIGHCLPPRAVSNAEIAPVSGVTDEWIRARTGIASRHVADAGTSTSDLAAIAAEQALRDSGLSASDIDLILVSTITPDTLTPSTACRVQARLGMEGVPAMDVSAACCGFLYGVHLASGLVRSGMHRRVLVIGAETMTRIVNPTDRQTAPIFGDGAGAAVIAESGSFDLLYTHLASQGQHTDLIHADIGTATPLTEQHVREGRHFLVVNGPTVFRHAVSAMTREVEAAVESLGITVDDIDWLVPHQANQRILDAVGEALGVDPARVVSDIEHTGNTSAASIPIAFSRHRARGGVKPGDIVVTVGFGAGLTSACQVWRAGESFDR